MNFLIIRDKVAACAKHYVGDGGTTRGINENNTVTDLHSLLSIHMPAYADAIYKGVSTVMVSYSSWNGEKMHANTKLITGYLKGTLKFKVCLHSLFFLVSHVLFVNPFVYVCRVLLFRIGKALIRSLHLHIRTTRLLSELLLKLG